MSQRIAVCGMAQAALVSTSLVVLHRGNPNHLTPDFKSGMGLEKIGSPSWTRTSDHSINSRMLYQLSYRGSLQCIYQRRYCRAKAFPRDRPL